MPARELPAGSSEVSAFLPFPASLGVHLPWLGKFLPPSALLAMGGESLYLLSHLLLHLGEFAVTAGPRG